MRYFASISTVVALVALMFVVAFCPGCSALQADASKAEGVVYAGLPPGTYQINVMSPLVSGSISYTKNEAASEAAGHTVLVAPTVEATQAKIPPVIHAAPSPSPAPSLGSLLGVAPVGSR